MRPPHKRSKPKSQLTRRRRLEQLLLTSMASALLNVKGSQIFNLQFSGSKSAPVLSLITSMTVEATILVMWMLTERVLPEQIILQLAVVLETSLVVIWLVPLFQHFQQPLALPRLSVTLKPKFLVQLVHCNRHAKASHWFSLTMIQIRAATHS
jgi:hypothetical protein